MIREVLMWLYYKIYVIIAIDMLKATVKHVYLICIYKYCAMKLICRNKCYSANLHCNEPLQFESNVKDFNATC